MTKCYFSNLENITIAHLKQTRKNIRAAVAWINFGHYKDVFNELLARGVKIKILLNNDWTNQRYMDDIQYLNNRGAKIRLVSFAGIMHHKFCVIDDNICMFGSFNWTASADIRNIEDLNICDDPNVISCYLLEFNALWELDKNDIKLLTNPICCPNCGSPMFNVLFMREEEKWQTRIDVLQICGCLQKLVYTDYYDINVYNNYIGLIQCFDNEIEEAQEMGDEISYQHWVARRDFAAANYLSTVRHNRMGLPIIHAVGVRRWDCISRRDGEWVYQIIWKERGTERYIRDMYDIL